MEEPGTSAPRPRVRSTLSTGRAFHVVSSDEFILMTTCARVAPLRAARVQKSDERRPSRDTRGGGAASRPVPRPLQSRSHTSRGAGTVVDPRATLAEDGAEVSPPSRSRLASVRHEGGVAGRERRRGRIDGGGRHALHAHGAGRGVHRGVQERGPRRRRPRAHHVRENPSLPSQHRARAGRPDRTRGDEVRPRRRRRPRRLATPPGHHTVRHAGAMPDVRRRRCSTRDWAQWCGERQTRSSARTEAGSH